MAIVDDTIATEDPPEPAKPAGGGEDGGGKPPEKSAVDKTAERLAALEAENQALRAKTDKSEKDAAGAQAYVQQLISALGVAATRTEPTRSDGDGADPVEQLRERMNDDPIGVLDQHFQSRIAPLANTYAENQAALNRQLTAERMGRDEVNRELWQKYEKEVDEFMSTMPGQVRVQPNAYENEFKFILAQHLDEVIEHRTSKKTEAEKRAFVEPATAAEGARPKKVDLSDLEKQVARGLGLTDEEYIKWR